MSLKEKLTNFFGLTDEEDYYEETYATLDIKKIGIC